MSVGGASSLSVRIERKKFVFSKRDFIMVEVEECCKDQVEIIKVKVCVGDDSVGERLSCSSHL